MGNNFSSAPSAPRGNQSRPPRGHPANLKGKKSPARAGLRGRRWSGGRGRARFGELGLAPRGATCCCAHLEPGVAPPTQMGVGEDAGGEMPKVRRGCAKPPGWRSCAFLSSLGLRWVPRQEGHRAQEGGDARDAQSGPPFAIHPLLLRGRHPSLLCLCQGGLELHTPSTSCISQSARTDLKLLVGKNPSPWLRNP